MNGWAGFWLGLGLMVGMIYIGDGLLTGLSRLAKALLRNNGERDDSRCEP